MKLMKCELCNQKIQTLFLSKISGTIVKINGKKHHICSQCQKKSDMKEIKAELS